jgi:hypothetical protein
MPATFAALFDVAARVCALTRLTAGASLMIQLMQLYKSIVMPESTELDGTIATAMFACMSGQREWSRHC